MILTQEAKQYAVCSIKRRS